MDLKTIYLGNKELKNYKNIQLLGPFNCGTNLLFNMLNNNLLNLHGEKVNVYNEGNLPAILVWKHTIVWNNLTALIDRSKTTLFIIMYKNIYNWINSIRNVPYDIKWNNKLNSNCKFLNRDFDSIVHLYNEYYVNYKKLLHYSNVIVLDYYKLIEKDHLIKYLNKLDNYYLRIINEVQVLNSLNKNSKPHHNVKSVNNSKQAQENKEINKKKIICEDNDFFIQKHLDKSIEATFTNL